LADGSSYLTGKFSNASVEFAVTFTFLLLLVVLVVVVMQPVVVGKS
jgi:hypothetical protein